MVFMHTFHQARMDFSIIPKQRNELKDSKTTIISFKTYIDPLVRFQKISTYISLIAVIMNDIWRCSGFLIWSSCSTSLILQVISKLCFYRRSNLLRWQKVACSTSATVIRNWSYIELISTIQEGIRRILMVTLVLLRILRLLQ